ncbi:hypothetical protein RUND412_006054 [Rhizina undulata]
MESFEDIKTAPAASRRHPEDSNASDDESDSEIENLNSGYEEENNIDRIPGSGPADMPVFKNTSQLAQGSYQTGVKGVLADAQSYESARRREQKARTQSNYGGYTAQPEPPAPAVSKDRSSDVESGDEDFVRTWRKNRLQELKSGVATTRRQSPSKRNYGRVEHVDASGYLDAVEKVSSDTIVVVTIYNDQSSESRFVEDCLNTLARRYTTTRFVKLHYTEAEMDVAVVPAILAYKDGDLFANLMRVVDEVPPGRSLSADSLELVLRRANVLHKE